MPTFEDSPFEAIHEPTLVGVDRPGVGGVISIIGIGIAYYLYVANLGTTARLIARARGVHAFLVNKQYFDELQDALVYRPVVAFGHFANTVFERYVVQGLVAGTVGLVRGFNVVVRGAQDRLRAYSGASSAASPPSAFYFLLASS